MTIERRVKLFRNGRNQAVRTPREFELPGHDAVIRRFGDALVLEPAKRAKKRSVAALLASWQPLSEPFPEIPDPPPEPVDL